MKVKGMNPIEQHVEKIVLGVVAVVLLAVLAMQILGQPNQVDVGRAKVPPQNVFVELQRQAETLDSQIKDASPALPAVRPTDLVQRYDQARGQASGAALALSAPLGTGVNIGAATGADMGSAGPASDRVAALVVPRTTAPIAASQWGTLDPFAVLAVPEYASFVPAQQPFDLASVTVETTFSGTQLRDALNNSGGVGVPRRFWAATGMAILGLEVERQKRLPDGTWSQSETIVTPPGTPRPTAALAAEAGLPELTELVSKASQAAPDVQRPMAPPTIAGPEWIPPSERTTAPATAQVSEADRLRRQLERAVAELERLQNPAGTRQPDSTRDPRGPGGPRTVDPGSSSPGQTAPRNQRRIEQLQREIEDLRRRLQELGQPDPTAPGTAQPGGRTGPSDPRFAPGQPGMQPGLQPGTAPLTLLEQDTVQLWAHDLGVEPGATYRYRTRVVLNNPLFRKGPVLDEQDSALQAAAREAFSRSEWSDWSAPVVVGATEYFFVTGADSDGSLSGGRTGATIEVFKMFYGHYRKSTLTVSPGDGMDTSVRIPDGLFLIDTRVIEPRAAAEAMFGDAAAALPAGLTKATGRLPINIGAFVLDIATSPVQTTDDLGRTVSVIEVVLHDRDGRVVVRAARSDVGTPSYQLANNSFTAAARSTLREPGQPAVSPSADLFVPPPAQP